MTGETSKAIVKAVERLTFFEQLEAPGVTAPPIRFTGNVTVQISGTATNIIGRVERSSQDPGSGREDWAPVESETFSGDLSAGISPRTYIEPAVGWWRFSVTTLTGGHVRVSITGDDA